MSTRDRFHLRISNGSGLPDSAVYVTAFGSAFDPSAPPPSYVSPDQAFVDFTPEGRGSWVVPTASTSSLEYSYPLTTFQPSGPDGAYDLYLPAGSGRVYLSIDAPLCLGIVTTGDTTISDPQFTDSNDPNYQVLYDKIQFNWNPAVPAVPISATLAVNTTAVDFFGLPFSLSMNGQTVGVAQSLSAMQLVLLDGNAGQPGLLSDDFATSWSLLPLYGSNDTVVRVLSPASATSPGATSFDQDYLQGYVESVWDHYGAAGGDTLTINVDIPGLENANGDYVGSVNSQGEFVFTNSDFDPPVSVSLPLPDTATVFSCSGPGVWTPGASPPQGSPQQGVIVSVLTAALNVGILPLPDSSTVLTNDFAAVAGLPPYYQGSCGGAPAYNLYAALLHSPGDQIYGFAFDNVAGESGQFVTTDTGSLATLTLNSLSGVTPPPLTGTGTYDVSLVAGYGGSGSVAYGGETLAFSTPASANSPSTINLPAAPAVFTVSYAVDGGEPQDYTVNMVTRSICPVSPATFSPISTSPTLISWPGA